MKLQEAIEFILHLKELCPLTAKKDFIKWVVREGYTTTQADELWYEAIDSPLYTDAVIRRRNEARNS